MSAERRAYNHIWQLEDILRYVEGKMSPEESVQIETAMREDPFLRDTVEGYSGHARIYIDHHLERLHERFGARSVSISPGRWLVVAATLLLLVVAGWFVGSNWQSIQGSFTSSKEKPEAQTQDENQKIADEQANHREKSAFIEPVDSLPGESISSDQALSQKSTRNAQRSYRKPKIPAGNGLVSGVVVDADGNPLAGANIRFPNNDALITTDFNGKFAIDLSAYDSLALVNHSDFIASTFHLEGRSEQRFQLFEGIAVEDAPVKTPEVSLLKPENESQVPQAPELTVDGISMNALQNGVSQIVEAAPERGFRRYDKYIKRNINYPESARIAEVEGDVIVQFRVLPDGELFDIRIIQSLGYGCDEEAIRLIREGPAWEVDEAGKIGQATYTISFKE